MKIAITGGSGFIGQAVQRELTRLGHEPVSFDRASGQDILGDLSGLAGAESVIHLAGLLGTHELFETPEQAINANVTGALRILQWCEANDAGYVGITMPDSAWANVYQATKLCAMRLATAWHRNFGVRVSHVRAYNAFGPGQKHGPGHPQKILPTFAWHAWRGLPIPIFGSGLQTVDLVYVEDLAHVLVRAVEFGNDEIFDAGTGVPLTVRSVASAVNRLTGNQADVALHPMRRGEEPESDIVAQGEGWSKLGWHPVFRPDDLKVTVESYRP